MENQLKPITKRCFSHLEGLIVTGYLEKKKKCRWRQVCTGRKSFAEMTKSLKERGKKNPTKNKSCTVLERGSPNEEWYIS